MLNLGHSSNLCHCRTQLQLYAQTEDVAYLRTTMSQPRLNHLLVLHVHQDLTDSLDLKAIAQAFVSANDYRGHVFCPFLVL